MSFPKFRTIDEAFLNFDTQTVNFTTGQMLTGGTVGDIGVIRSQVDNGASGTLTLEGLTTAEPPNNEPLSDEGSGDGLADGTLSYTEYVWETHPIQESGPPVSKARLVTHSAVAIRDATGFLVGIRRRASFRSFPLAFNISRDERDEFEFWFSLGAFWLYPNQDLSTRYAAVWTENRYEPQQRAGDWYSFGFNIIEGRT